MRVNRMSPRQVPVWAKAEEGPREEGVAHDGGVLLAEFLPGHVVVEVAGLLAAEDQLPAVGHLGPAAPAQGALQALGADVPLVRVVRGEEGRVRKLVS